jgi:uncharacterized Tic20 family protein
MATSAGTVSPVASYARDDERTWALTAHLGGIFFSFAAPLFVLLAKGNESPTVRAHAIEALNFQITWGAVLIVTSIVGVCSFGTLAFLPLIAWAIVIVFSIIGGTRANQGQVYRYPMAVRVAV